MIATPSRAAGSSSRPPGYMAGLMTPPASNLRSTPSPEATKSLSPPQLQSRPLRAKTPEGQSSRNSALERRVSTSSVVSDGPVTPLLREQSYDRDAEDNQVDMQSFDDDDLDVQDDEAPAFRSLEAELDASVED